MSMSFLVLLVGEVGGQMTTISQMIQLGGVIVSFLVVVRQIVNLIRDWRGGSPELRVIKDHVVESNDRIQGLLERIINRLDGR
jgi:hypothetical protein